ncbi:hypothetical protein RCO48_04480 [Peribacillus frigoritolerans]|nr:hypothetical protein [Peribacillus frigoritolerans]
MGLLFSNIGVYGEQRKKIKKGMVHLERTIKSLDVVAEATKPVIYTFEIGKVFGGQIVDDIINHDGVFKLYNRQDELIMAVNLPVVCVEFEHGH